jgi:HPt (histidine-containing phosphotransfer) domain-containing protein
MTDDVRKAFDIAALDRQTGGDRALGLEIVQMFLDDYATRLAAIRAAVERGDAPGVLTTAHTLKGAAGYLSAAFVVEAASRLETMGREGRLAEAPAALQRLDGAVAQLIPELRKAMSTS